MKKVLVITYYWPPSGGAGVQRWLKFVKYFRQFNWEPIVYTAQDADFPVLDTSLEKDLPEGIEVLKTPIREPYGLYRQLTGGKKADKTFNVFVSEKEKPNWKTRLALYIRANYFIPDARFLWIRPSVKFLEKWLRENRVDLIVSTGPPHSLHLIALQLKQKTGLPWLADFRDPWTTIDFADDMPFSKRAIKKNESLERQVLTSADHIVVVSNLMRDEFQTKTTKPISVITNGFDHADFDAVEAHPQNDTITLLHTGSLNQRRNHPALWKALAEWVRQHPEWKSRVAIKLIGKTDKGVRDELAKLGIDSLLQQIDYMPHDQIAAEQKSASVLLLLINRFGEESTDFKSAKGTLTGKFFEYLAADRPILAIGIPGGQVDEILAETQTGKVYHFDDEPGIRQFLESHVQKGTPHSSQVSIQAYSRMELTRKISIILDGMVR